MMSMITPEDMKTTVYVTKGGNFVEAEADSDGKPVRLRYDHPVILANNPKWSSDKTKFLKTGSFEEDDDRDKHFHQDFNPLSFKLEPEKRQHVDDDPAYKLSFYPPGVTDTTNKIVYLPFFAKNITSTVIRIKKKDPSVCYFITDDFSGCSFFIDQLREGSELGDAGDLVCYHANALHKPKPTDAVTTMNKQLDTARKVAFPKAESKAILHKETYNKQAMVLESEGKNKGWTNVEFNGGTTVIGFLVKGKWQFWFQTYGKVTHTESSGDTSGDTSGDKSGDSSNKPKSFGKKISAIFKNKDKDKDKGKSKEVPKEVHFGVRDLPNKIIDAQCFWREG